MKYNYPIFFTLFVNMKEVKTQRATAFTFSK